MRLVRADAYSPIVEGVDVGHAVLRRFLEERPGRIVEAGEVIAVCRGEPFDTVAADPEALLAEPSNGDLDLAQIRDQDRAKRAMEIAAHDADGSTRKRLAGGADL